MAGLPGHSDTTLNRGGSDSLPASHSLLSRVIRAIALIPQQTAILLIRGYQLALSPALPSRCRFFPSCSHYTLEAVRRYGAVKGSWLGARRLIRCHPWNPGGFDPVP